MTFNRKVDLTIVSSQRAVLFGLAMIAIVWHHLPVEIPFAVGGTVTVEFMNNLIHYYCDIGVDIFLILSGFGLYYSMKKREKTKETDNDFYKKRIMRIAPYHAVGFTLIWLLNCPGLPLQAVAGNYLMVGQWIGVGSQFFWFLQLILVLYILTPMLFRSMEKSRITTMAASFAIVFVFWVASWGNMDLYIMAFRMLSFVIGMYIGYLAFNGFKINIVYEIALYSLTVFSFALYWYVDWILVPDNLGRLHSFYGIKYVYNTLAAPGLVLGLSRIFSFLSNIQYAKVIPKVFAFVGNYTIGIYIFHVWIAQYGFSTLFESVIVSPTADTVILSILSWIPVLIVLTVGGIIFELVLQKAFEMPDYLKKRRNRQDSDTA